MICTYVRIQTFSKWQIYILGTWANNRILVAGHVCNAKKDMCAIKHENMIKRDYNAVTYKYSTIISKRYHRI